MLNFSPHAITGTVHSEHLPPESCVTDMGTGDELGVVDRLHSFSLELGAYEGRSLLLEVTAEEESAEV